MRNDRLGSSSGPAPGDRGTEVDAAAIASSRPPAGWAGWWRSSGRQEPRKLAQTTCAASRACWRPARSPPPPAPARLPTPPPDPPEEEIPCEPSVWNGVNDLRVETVAGPRDHQPARRHRAGDDVHDLRLRPALLGGYIPTMKPGDIIGHEFMGEVVDIGPEVKQGEEGRPGGRAVVHRLRPVLVLRRTELYSLCDNTNPKPSCRADARAIPRPASTATATRSAARPAPRQYMRVPFADDDCFKVPEGHAGREGAVPLGRRARPATWAPTSATSSRATPWPSGAAAASGLMAQQSALLLGAERVIAIDRLPERLRMAPSSSAPRRSTTGGRQRPRGAEGDDRRPRPRRLHRRRGDGGAWHRPAIRLRPRQAGAAPADGPRRGAARGIGLPQGRHPLGPGRLRLDGQVPDRASS